MADAVPAESAAPPSAANPTTAYLSFTLLSVVCVAATESSGSLMNPG